MKAADRLRPAFIDHPDGPTADGSEGMLNFPALLLFFLAAEEDIVAQLKPEVRDRVIRMRERADAALARARAKALTSPTPDTRSINDIRLDAVNVGAVVDFVDAMTAGPPVPKGEYRKVRFGLIEVLDVALGKKETL